MVYIYITVIKLADWRRIPTEYIATLRNMNHTVKKLLLLCYIAIYAANTQLLGDLLSRLQYVVGTSVAPAMPG
jgi:hypothetical protein